MLTINKCNTDFIVLMPIAQSKRKLIAATALFIAVGSLTGAIATGGAATLSYATTQGQADGGSSTGQQGGQQGRVIHQGTVTSSPVPLPGREGEQYAAILPLTPNGTVYSGVLTFTATEPVDVVVLNVQNLNQTERLILNGTDTDLGTLNTARLDNQTSIAITSITPTYGDSPAPSATLPFAGNALWLHSPEGTRFAASYAVSAQVMPAENVNEISNVTLAATDGGGDDGGDDGGDGGTVDEAATAATATDGGGDGGNATATDGGGDGGGDDTADEAT